MNIALKEKWVGAATLVVLVLSLGLLNQAGNVSGAETGDLRIKAMFGKADGVRPGTPVRIAGVQVGVVHGMDLDEKYRAILTLSLDPGLQLPDDSEASIETDGLFGAKFISLRVGFEDVMLQSGDLITRNYDSQIVGDLLEQIISEGRASLEARRQLEQRLKDSQD